MKTEMTAVEITKKVATHEAGHGALYAILFQDLRNFRLTLANRDNQNIAQLEFDTNFPCTEQKEAVNSIAVCLGGKIAEIIKYGKPFDNENHYATDNRAILNILKKSVYDPLHKQGPKRPEKDINREIDQIINHYVAQAEEIAYGTLVRFWPAVDEIAEKLIRKKTLNGDEIREILARNWPAPARAAACQFEIT